MREREETERAEEILFFRQEFCGKSRYCDQNCGGDEGVPLAYKCILLVFVGVGVGFKKKSILYAFLRPAFALEMFHSCELLKHTSLESVQY